MCYTLSILGSLELKDAMRMCKYFFCKKIWRKIEAKPVFKTINVLISTESFMVWTCLGSN